MNRKAAFSLVELLVAVTLMVILTSSISYVFITAKNVFVQADSTIQVYQNARNAFDIMESELSVAEKTHDMLFFSDSPAAANKHYDAGVEEFFGIGEKLDPPDSAYAYAMTIYGGEYPDPINPAAKPRRCDSIYFKSTTMVAGKSRPAIIIYTLDKRHNQTKPILKKYILYRKETRTTDGRSSYSYTYSEEPPDGTGQDICLYVSEFKVEYYYDNPYDSTPPDFISVPKGSKKVFCYMGTRKQGSIDANGLFSVSDIDSGIFDKFSQLTARDRIYLFDGMPKSTIGWDNTKDTDYLIETIDNEGKTTLSGESQMAASNIASVNFRAGYLPAALKITIKILDNKGLHPRTITKIIRLKTG
ncbi:MAG: type II secretion system protein [Planctomycetota bacterium]